MFLQVREDVLLENLRGQWIRVDPFLFLRSLVKLPEFLRFDFNFEK